jgi:hypothetical protein
MSALATRPAVQRGLEIPPRSDRGNEEAQVKSAQTMLMR